MKPRHACIMCGKKNVKTNHLQKIELPHGTIHLCHSNKCQELITLKLNNDNAPIIWVGRDSLYEDDDNNSILTKEEMETLTDKELIGIAKDLQDWIWSDSFGDTFHEGLDQCAEYWREEKEKKRVQECPKKELPLLINDLKWGSNRKLLEKRLRGK